MTFATDMLLKKVQPMLNASDELINLTMFCNGEMEDGEEFYAYFNLLPSKLSELTKAVEKKMEITLFEYGEIIEAGSGLIPSDEVKKRMEEEYYVDYDFSAKLIEAVLKGN